MWVDTLLLLLILYTWYSLTTEKRTSVVVSVHIHSGGGYQEKLRNILQTSLSFSRVNKHIRIFPSAFSRGSKLNIP